MATTKKAAAGISVATAAAITLAVPFVSKWEGLWTTAKVDTIGTGQPVTVCYGATRAEIPDLQAGQKFTAEQCRVLLAKSLPKYAATIDKCLKADVPTSLRAAAYSASYNAGAAAVCKSPMIAKANAGDLKGACESFKGWYIRARGVVVKGLVNRRADESKLCYSGLNQRPETKPLSPAKSFWKKFFSIFIKGN